MKQINLFIIIVVNLFFLSFTINNGETNYWKILQNVKAKSTFNPETEDFSIKFTFSKKVRKLEGKTIQLKGFLMPDFNEKLMLTRLEGHHFCCGGFGPTDVVGIEFSDSMKFPIENPVVLEGVLRLNSDDPFRHLYILEKVRCLDCKNKEQTKSGYNKVIAARNVIKHHPN